MRRLHLLLLSLLVVLAGCGTGIDVGSEPADVEEAAAGSLEIHHIDVGQGDSTLVVTPGDETILIDTGDWRDDGAAVIDYLETHDIDRIDHLIATHAHADHIGGHAAVVEYLEEHGEGVGAAYDSGVPHTSATYENYLDAIEANDVQLFEVAAGDTLPLEDESVEATVLNPPEGDSGVGLDANSVTLAVDFGSFSYLTTGDAERTAEQRLVEEYGDALAADAYQAGHHGSSTSSTAPFLGTVAPDIAVVSSARESQYGHPHDEVLEAFAERDIETYWTGVHGDVVVSTDGETVSVSTERDGPTDPTTLLERKHEARETNPQSALEGPPDRPPIDGAAVPTGP
ncbi:ComEC/Rec2 family competence protein [Halopiger djelfimassiliensis]|uniref:ComEC/Rec2 family competence protein n=1 Tax=Halopiger djelfimassiliensis TaxID=1293047 RepID=UPI000677AD44|nr:ComEC/Rec2 family competence protein [Halopiger djelfimassiliensis]